MLCNFHEEQGVVVVVVEGGGEGGCVARDEGINYEMKKEGGGSIYVFFLYLLSGKKLYASTVSQVRDQPMPGEDEPLHAYVEVNTAINTAEKCRNFLNLDIAIFRVTSQSKCRKQLQRSRRSFNKGLM